MNSTQLKNNTSALTLLQTESKKLLALKSEQEELKNQLSEVNSLVKQKEEVDIPYIMDSLDVNKISFNDMDITKSIKYRSNITKSNQLTAFEYLKNSNNEAAIKKIITIDFNNNPAIIKLLDENNIVYDITQSVHHATLSKIITELIEEGKLSTEEFETFSIYAQSSIKIKVKS